MFRIMRFFSCFIWIQNDPKTFVSNNENEKKFIILFENVDYDDDDDGDKSFFFFFGKHHLNINIITINTLWHEYKYFCFFRWWSFRFQIYFLLFLGNDRWYNSDCHSQSFYCMFDYGQKAKCYWINIVCSMFFCLYEIFSNVMWM